MKRAKQRPGGLRGDQFRTEGEGHDVITHYEVQVKELPCIDLRVEGGDEALGRTGNILDQGANVTFVFSKLLDDPSGGDLADP